MGNVIGLLPVIEECESYLGLCLVALYNIPYIMNSYQKPEIRFEFVVMFPGQAQHESGKPRRSSRIM